MNADARQRWRVTFRRDATAAGPTGRDAQATIESNLAAAGVPVAGRTQLAASLASGVAAERELIDVTLLERWPVSRARDAIAAALPLGHELVDCHDVWLGEPALAAQARGAEYRIVLQGGATPDELRMGVASVLTSERLERRRPKGDRVIDYDLRPWLAELEVVEDGPDITLRVLVHIDPERGAGRPEEVVAALGDACGGAHLEIARLTRTRIVLAGG